MNKYIELAVKESLKASKKNEVPVGVVIVKNDKIIVKTHNKRHKNKKVTDHAEIIAINHASKKLKDWRLDDCEMYVTLEPCLMCQSVIRESRIKKVYYILDNIKKDIILNKKIELVKVEFEKEKSEKILKEFFKNKRK